MGDSVGKLMQPATDATKKAATAGKIKSIKVKIKMKAGK